MNTVQLIGRLTKDPDVRYGAQSQTAVARFSIAINRGKDKNGNDLGADFPTIVCFGKTAELVEKYVRKGQLIGIQGRVQTGKYEKDGHTYYTTDIAADRIEFLGKNEKTEEKPEPHTNVKEALAPVEGFSRVTDDDIPF